MFEEQQKLLDKKGIAKFLSISTKQVEKLELPFINVGKRKRFDPAEVLIFLKDGIKNNK